MIRYKIELKDGQVLRLKLTVEERADGTHIATSWNPINGHENDREIYEFETYDGAFAQMLEMALEEALAWTNLKKVVSYE